MILYLLERALFTLSEKSKIIRIDSQEAYILIFEGTIIILLISYYSMF